jgi:long-chain acyl-CoA synthetase
LKEGITATEKEIIDHCKNDLAKYKVPSKVVFQSSLPMTAIGKVLRRELVKALSEKS